MKMGKADGLSRRLDWKIRTENNNSNQVLMKYYWICNLTEVVIEEPEINIIVKVLWRKE